jgi:hypothetical protein
MSELKKVGVLWKPRDGAKSLGSGVMTIAGMKQRFVILKNDYKTKESQPDFTLMSGDEPETDNWKPSTEKTVEITEDDIPF